MNDSEQKVIDATRQVAAHSYNLGLNKGIMSVERILTWLTAQATLVHPVTHETLCQWVKAERERLERQLRDTNA